MHPRIKKISIILVILIVLAIYPIYKLSALNSIEIQSFTITNVRMNQQMQLVVEGNAVLYNPSRVSATINQITYNGVINNESVFNGTIIGATIPAHSNASFPFEQTIMWVPDLQTALAITAGNEVDLTVDIQAEVSYFFFTLTGNKEIIINITSYIKPILDNQIMTISNLMSGFL